MSCRHPLTMCRSDGCGDGPASGPRQMLELGAIAMAACIQQLERNAPALGIKVQIHARPDLQCSDVATALTELDGESRVRGLL